MFETLKIEAVTYGWEECDAPGPFVRLTMGGEKFEVDPERAAGIGQMLIDMGAKALGETGNALSVPFVPRKRAR